MKNRVRSLFFAYLAIGRQSLAQSTGGLCTLLDLVEDPLSLDFSKTAKLETGDYGKPGSKYRYDNAAENIDVIVTLVRITDSKIVNLCNDGFLGLRINDYQSGNYTLDIDIVKSGTMTLISPRDLVVLTFDIDGVGGDTLTDFTVFHDADGTFLHNPTYLQGAPMGNDVKFTNVNVGKVDTVDNPLFGAGAVYLKTNSFTVSGGFEDSKGTRNRHVSFEIDSKGIERFNKHVKCTPCPKAAALVTPVPPPPTPAPKTVPSNRCDLMAQVKNAPELKFSGKTASLVSGENRKPGSVYRFSDIGHGMDALVTLIDITENSAVKKFLQGGLGIELRDETLGGYTISIELVDAGKESLSKPAIDVVVTAFDIDGQSGDTLTDYVEYHDYDGWFVNSPTHMKATVDQTTGRDIKFVNTNVGKNDKSGSAAYAAGAVFLQTSKFFLSGGFENSKRRHNRGIYFKIGANQLDKFDGDLVCNTKSPTKDVVKVPGDTRSTEKEVRVSPLTVGLSHNIPQVPTSGLCSLLDLVENPLTLDFSKTAKLEAGDYGKPGSQYRYKNAGENIDVIVTLVRITDSKIVNLCNDGFLGLRINDYQSGNYTLDIDIVKSGTKTLIPPKDLVVLTFDIDGVGGDTLTDFTVFHDSDGTFLHNPTYLQGTTTGNDVKFTNVNVGKVDTVDNPLFGAGAVYLKTNSFTVSGGFEDSKKTRNRHVSFEIDSKGVERFKKHVKCTPTPKSTDVVTPVPPPPTPKPVPSNRCDLMAQVKDPPTLNFKGKTASLVSGESRKPGSVYRFSDIGHGMDALVTLVKITEHSQVTKFLQNGLGITLRDKPVGSYTISVELVDAGTTKSSKLVDLVVTAFDIDGQSGDSLSDYVEYHNYDGWFVNSPTYMKAVVEGSDVKFLNTNIGKNDKTNSASYGAGAVFLKTNKIVLSGGFENSKNRHNRGVWFEIGASKVDKFNGDLVCNEKTPTPAPTTMPTQMPTSSPSASPSAALPSSVAVKNAVYVGGDDKGAGCEAATESIKAMTGTEITYCFTVTNTGDAPLTEIVVKNKDLDFKDDSINKLLPGDSATVIFTTTADSGKKNEVVATGSPTSKTGDNLPGRDHVIAKDSSEVVVIKPDPSVSITNTGYVGDDLGGSCGTKDKAKFSADKGDSVVFCMKVKNTGNTVLSNVVIKLPIVDFKSSAVGTLAPGESQEVDFVHDGLEGTMDALADVTANPTMPDGTSMADPVVDDDMAKVVVADVKSATKPSFGNCIETNWKKAGETEELTCAAMENNVSLESGASDKPIQCAVGDKVKVTVDGSIRFKDLTPRYDVAWYVATDGGDAMTGTCLLTALGKGGEYAIVQSSGSDKVVGSVVWDADDGDGDACGDVLIPDGSDGANLDMPLVVDLELPCQDENDDGLLDFAICFTWRQDCNNDVCSFEAVIPGNKATGCYCTRVDISNTEVDTPDDNSVEPC